jgi:type II secretory pathway predicted ATPase ExeA
MNKNLLSLYGLKWNPFSPEIPIESLLATPAIENFIWRIEQGLVREGGFALISGEPGAGKSVAMRLLADRLQKMRDVKTGAITHPSGNLAGFYREMGDLFGIELSPHNRWGGFKALRERWLAHLEGTLLRPVLLIDEAQEMQNSVLNELRLLSSTEFDSCTVLTVIFAGDGRFNHKLRHRDLIPLGSRIRTRLNLDYASREELQQCLTHLLKSAGNPRLMKPKLMSALCEHAAGNYRVLMSMAGELFAVATQRELTDLDEDLFLDVFGAPQRKSSAEQGA